MTNAHASGWRGQLTLNYRSAEVHGARRTIAHDAHEGPLRVLQPLYPEGPGICHQVLVHPPGGVVGGDELHINATLQSDTHVLVTTPGATRFYRSEGAVALQQTTLDVAAGARLEWLPMETIAHTGCRADNVLRARLAPGAEMLGWDILVLGLTAAEQPFQTGWYRQHLDVLPGFEGPGAPGPAAGAGRWLERGRIAAEDATLLHGPLGWAGHSVLATLWFAAGSAWAAPRREALLDAARAVVTGHALAATAGVTAPQPSAVVLRVLAHRVEPVMQLLAAVRAAWRQAAWGLNAEPPRIWRT